MKASHALFLCAAIGFGGFLSAQSSPANIVFTENWSEYSLGQSVIGSGYKWFATPPVTSGAAANTTIVKDGFHGKRYLTVTSNGYDEAATYFPIVVSEKISGSSPLSFSGALSTTIETDIRYRTPGVTATALPYPAIRLGVDGGRQFWFGMIDRNTVTNTAKAYITMPGEAQVRSEMLFDLDSWYHFSLTFDHVNDSVNFSVFGIDVDGVVSTAPIWSVSSVGAISLEELQYYRFEVAKAGPVGSFGSSDFSGITISQQIPEGKTVALAMGVAGLALVLVLRRRMRAAA